MSNFLHQFKQPCPADFTLQLADLSTFTCQQVVRVVPQKRLVCRGVWQQKAVYAKLFIDAHAARYFARDLSGVTDLVAAKIATPALLFQGQAQDGTYVLVFEAVANSLNAEQVWQQSNAKARFILAKNLVAEIAKLHKFDLLQTDLYLKNFLVADEIIYTLDGDGIRKFTHLSQPQALQNLSVLLSKFDVLEVEIWLADLLKVYADNRAWQRLPDAALIKEMTNALRMKAASNYADKKVFRTCSDVQTSALGGLFHAASSHAKINIPKNMAELDAFIQPQNLLKNGNTCTVALAEIDSKKIVIKRYNIKNIWHGIGRAFRQTRAAKSWANAHRLMLLDIATAAPIALIEKRYFGLNSKAYFLAEYIDAPDVAEYFAKTHNKTDRAEAVKNVAKLFYRLYLLQISHGDMKATNIKMQGTQPVLIDLDSMRQHRKTNVAAHVRDLQRFMQNWHASNQPRDNALYNAFVKTFKVIYPDDSLLIKAGIATNKE